MVKSIVLALAMVAGCNGTSSPSRSAPAHEPPFHLALGEATVIELGASEHPVWKLHADGSIEQLLTFRHKPPEWQGGAAITADGTFVHDGQPLGALADPYEKPHHDGTKMTIEGNVISFDIPGLPLARLELHDGSTITLTGRPKDPSSWRIEASDPAVARTAFLVFGTNLEAAID